MERVKVDKAQLTDFERKVLLEYYRRHKHLLASRSPTQLLKASLFPSQHGFIYSESELALACCTRRAGKSHACAVGLITKALETPSSECLYIGLTRLTAKNIMVPNIERLLKKFDIDYEFFKAELRFVFKNQSQIVLTGVGDSIRGIQKLLGVAYDLVVIDEAQSFPEHIKPLIYEVLMITVAERKGKIRMIGTPGMIASGFFFDVAHGHEIDSQWATYHWSWTENETVKVLIQEQIERMIKASPLVAETPAFKRNYLGEWVADSDALVYKYAADKNLVDSEHVGDLPLCDNFILGVDLGYIDATGFCVVGWGPHDPRVIVFESYKCSGLIPSDIIKVIQSYHDKYDNKIIRTVVDEGGLGKSIAEEWRRRYMVAVTPAKKTEKRLFIDTVNGLFIQGHIQIIKETNGELLEELKNLVWLNSERKHEHPACENHILDALCYSIRESLSYLFTPEVIRDPLKEQEEALLKAHISAVRDRASPMDRYMEDQDGWR